MKKLLAALVISAAMVFSAGAEEGYNFYDNQYGSWRVIGNTGGTTNPSCYAETSWQDGSFLHLVKDLADGEVYIYFQNMQWQIVDPVGEYSLRMNIYTSNNVNGGEYIFYLQNKNTIVIPNLNVDDFLPSFIEGSQIQLIMSGTISNAEIPLEGSSQAISLMVECIGYSSWY